MIIPIFIPHGGCPERCRFCEQSISGGSAISAAAITATIQEYLAGAQTVSGPRASREVAFYGGTFTALSQRLQLQYLDAVKPFLGGNIERVRIATRPDAIDGAWMRKLRDEYAVRTVELGVQSFSVPVLRALGRSHDVASVDAATAILKDLGIEIGFHLMFGCPGETQWSEELARFDENLARLRPDFARIHPLLVLQGTALEDDYKQGLFMPLNLEQAIEQGAQLARALTTHGVRLIRAGLQANEAMDQGGVIAGPYHPAFGELVRARRYRQALATNLEKELRPLAGTKTSVEIDVVATEESALKGQRRENMLWLERHFPSTAFIVKTIHENRNKEQIHDNFKIRVRHLHRPA